MEASQPVQGSNRNVIVIILVAVVLCCCCVVTGVGGYYGYQAYQAARDTVETLQDFEIPTTDPTNPDQPVIPIPGLPGFGEGDLPAGGLSDDVTRATTWGSMLFTGPIFDCATPTVEGTAIEVVQEPDSNGVWIERWDVACGDGTTRPFTITFSPADGYTDVNIAPPQ